MHHFSLSATEKLGDWPVGDKGEWVKNCCKLVSGLFSGWLTELLSERVMEPILRSLEPLRCKLFGFPESSLPSGSSFRSSVAAPILTVYMGLLKKWPVGPWGMEFSEAEAIKVDEGIVPVEWVRGGSESSNFWALGTRYPSWSTAGVGGWPSLCVAWSRKW